MDGCKDVRPDEGRGVAAWVDWLTRRSRARLGFSPEGVSPNHSGPHPHADLVAEVDAITVSGEGRVMMHVPEPGRIAQSPLPSVAAAVPPATAAVADSPGVGGAGGRTSFDYDDTFNGGENLLAGAISGLIAETIMHPFDTVSHRAKVHPSSQYGNFAGAFRLIYQQGEGHGGRGWGVFAGGRLSRISAESCT